MTFCFQQTAIATSVNLRCYAVLSPRSDGKVGLEAPDLALDAEWDIASLPWNLLPLSARENGHRADKDLEAPLISAIEDIVHLAAGPTGEKRAIGAGVSWLYLYMAMAGSPDAA